MGGLLCVCGGTKGYVAPPPLSNYWGACPPPPPVYVEIAVFEISRVDFCSYCHMFWWSISVIPPLVETRIKWLENNHLFEKIWSYWWKIFSLQCRWKFDGAWHGLSAMLLYQWRHISVTEATMTSYWFQIDVIGMLFCQGTKQTSWLLPSYYGNRSMLSSHLRFEGSIAYNVLLKLIHSQIF